VGQLELELELERRLEEQLEVPEERVPEALLRFLLGVPTKRRQPKNEHRNFQACIANMLLNIVLLSLVGREILKAEVTERAVLGTLGLALTVQWYSLY